MQEILDNWTVAQAWEHTYGKEPRPTPEAFPESRLNELDAVVASYFGDETTEGRKKAAAALAYLWPRMMSSQLPPGPEFGQRKHIADAVKRAVTSYYDTGLADQEDLQRIVLAMDDWDLAILKPCHWEVVWDAMGMFRVNVRDLLLWQFYEFADRQSFFFELE
jgi:hypothetical protein